MYLCICVLSLLFRVISGLFLLLLKKGVPFLFSVQAGQEVDEHWPEHFNTNKNCQQEKKIAKLKNEVGAHELRK